MDIIGKLNGIMIDLETGRPIISFFAEDKAALQVETLRDKRLRIEVKTYRERRTLDQNSYYWLLVGKLADILGYSKPHVHNMLLRSYGQLATHKDKLIDHIVKDSASEIFDEHETLHLYPTSHTTVLDNGETYRLYYELKGTHDMDSKEMAALLDGTIEECKAQGIQTATPEELARMRALC